MEDCATTEKNDIYSHAETSGARRGAFFGFSRPALRQFSQIFISDRFWRTAGAFVRSAIFFKLQVVLCPLCPPRPPHARATPAPRPHRTQFDRLKSLDCGATAPAQKKIGGRVVRNPISAILAQVRWPFLLTSSSDHIDQDIVRTRSIPRVGRCPICC